MFEAIKTRFNTLYADFSNKVAEYKIQERVSEIALRIFEALENAYQLLVDFGRRVRIGCYDGIAKVVGLLILPVSVLYSEKEISQLNQKADEKIQQINSTTASVAQRVQPQDGIAFTHPRAANPMRATTIHFLSNNELWQQTLPTLMEFHRETGSDLICHNWRKFSKTDEEHVADGVAQVKELLASGILPDKILLSGYSFGGAIATLVAARLNEEGIIINVCSDRSFSSLQAVIKNRFRFTARVVGACVSYYGWKLDSQAALPNIRSTLIVIDSAREKEPTFKQAVEKAEGLLLRKIIPIAMNDEEFRQENPQTPFASQTRPYSQRERQELYTAVKTLLLN